MADLYQHKYRVQTTRLSTHSYAAGVYFVTICTKNRIHTLGEIQCIDDIPTMILSNIGVCAEKCLQAIPLHFPHVRVPLYVVMPNHIHVILQIDSNATQCTEMQNFASLRYGPQCKNLPSVVRGLKIGVTKYARENHLEFEWQPRYYEHIIRNQDEWNACVAYIQNNVARWGFDELNKKR